MGLASGGCGGYNGVVAVLVVCSLPHHNPKHTHTLRDTASRVLLVPGCHVTAPNSLD